MTTTTARSIPSTPPPSDAAASDACRRHGMMNGAANGGAAPAAVGVKRCAPSTSSSSSSSSPHVVSPAKKKAKKSCPERKKAPDAPRRPLSAYNIFFLVERERLLNDNNNDQNTFTYTESLVEEAVKANLKGAKLKKKRSHRKSHGKIAFKDLATAVSERWKVLSTENKALFEKYATHERNKYKKLIEVWQKQRKKEVVVDPDQEDSAATAPKAVTSSSCSSAVSRTPAPPCAGPEPAKIVSPSADDFTKPLKIIDATSSPHVPSFAPRDDSLTAMMRRGNAYASLLSQKQAELELRNSMLDHMQMLMGYPIDAAVAPEQYTSYDHRGQYVSQSVPISSNAMDGPAHAPYVEYNNNIEPVDFYDAAEATFQLAHRVLPPPPAQCFSNPIDASYAAAQTSSHVNCYENSSPFVDSYENGSGSQAFHHQHHQAQVSHGSVYECNTTPAGYNDLQYNMVVDPNQHMMYDASCGLHVPAYEPYVPPQQQEATFPTAMPAVRSLPSYEPTTAFGLDESSDEDEDDDDNDGVDNTSVVGVDVDDESIMGVLNPSADPFSLASVFE